MSFTILDGIPPPPPKVPKPARIAGPITLALESLEIGQCAQFPHPSYLKYNPPAICASKITKRTGRTFRYKTEADAIWVWRIS